MTIRPVGFIQVYENVNLAFYSNASSTFLMFLTVDDSTIIGDGFSTTNIRVKVYNSFGVPPDTGTVVTFSLDPEVGTLSTESVLLNEVGEAVVGYTSAQVAEPISILVTASSTIETGLFLPITVSDVISIGLTPQKIGSIEVTAESTGVVCVFLSMTTPRRKHQPFPPL